ncbi:MULTISPECIES: cytochrome bd oxidase small subunit CydS [Bacillaceae]
MEFFLVMIAPHLILAGAVLGVFAWFGRRPASEEKE